MVFRLNVNVVKEKVEMLLDAGRAEVVKAALRLSVMSALGTQRSGNGRTGLPRGRACRV